MYGPSARDTRMNSGAELNEVTEDFKGRSLRDARYFRLACKTHPGLSEDLQFYQAQYTLSIQVWHKPRLEWLWYRG